MRNLVMLDGLRLRCFFFVTASILGRGIRGGFGEHRDRSQNLPSRDFGRQRRLHAR